MAEKIVLLLGIFCFWLLARLLGASRLLQVGDQVVSLVGLLQAGENHLGTYIYIY
jgi:hypothetical protein